MADLVDRPARVTTGGRRGLLLPAPASNGRRAAATGLEVDEVGVAPALAGVRSTNRITVLDSQCEIASATRCLVGQAGSMSNGTVPFGQRNWLPGRMTASKMARPSTTAYCTALGPKVRPETKPVRTSSELSSSGLSWDPAASSLTRRSLSRSCAWSSRPC